MMMVANMYTNTQTNERKSIKQNTRKQIETIKRLKNDIRLLNM